MKQQDIRETIARRLGRTVERALAADGIAAAVAAEGGGVHWHVDATHGARSCRVHCFHYGDMAGALVIGPKGNAHLRHVSARRPPEVRSGAEFLTYFLEGAEEVASGRTQDENVTVDALTRWLAGGSLTSLHDAHEHIDREFRAHRALASALKAELLKRGTAATVKLEKELGPSYELWVYSEGRACQLASLPHGSVGCALLLASTQVVRIEVPTSAAAIELVDSWLTEQQSIADIRSAFPGAEVSPHAEQFEAGDVAGWLWSNLLDGAGAGDPVLEVYRPLLLEIVARPTVSSFFAFTSLNRLCFSLCSHYPFETRAMPMVVPAGDETLPRYKAATAEARIEGDASEVAAFLEDVLTGVQTRPWHGVAGELLIETINQALEEQGLELRASRVQRRQWWDVVLRSKTGQVRLDGPHDGKAFCSLSFRPEHGEHEQRNPRTLAEAVRLIAGWLGT